MLFLSSRPCERLSDPRIDYLANPSGWQCRICIISPAPTAPEIRTDRVFSRTYLEGAARSPAPTDIVPLKENITSLNKKGFNVGTFVFSIQWKYIAGKLRDPFRIEGLFVSLPSFFLLPTCLLFSRSDLDEISVIHW